MGQTLPVDLAARHDLRPSRWAVVWICDDAGHQREAYFSEQALADAYAAARRGVVVPLAALREWPE